MRSNTGLKQKSSTRKRGKERKATPAPSPSGSKVEPSSKLFKYPRSTRRLTEAFSQILQSTDDWRSFVESQTLPTRGGAGSKPRLAPKSDSSRKTPPGRGS